MGRGRVTDNAHILVVDDDEDICELVEAALTREGYRVTTANNTSEMRQVMTRTPVNLVVLDIMLPDGNGLDEMRRLSAQSDICVIILSGKGEPIERILGLESGADDYLAKPFHVHELIARIRSVLRRGQNREASSPSMAEFCGWTLNLESRELTAPGGEPIPLTTGEFNLLHILVTHPRRVLSRDQIMEFLHNRTAEPFDRSIDVQIGRLRRKIEPDAKSPTIIKTVRGTGYLFAQEVKLSALPNP